MKTKLLLILIFIPLIGVAQSTFWSESFETDGNGSRYTPEVEILPSSSGASCNDHFARNLPTDNCSGDFIDMVSGSYSNLEGSYLWACEDNDDGGVGGSGNYELFITFDNIPSITGKDNLAFRGRFGVGASNVFDNETVAPTNPDFMIVEYQIDGGGYQEALAFHPTFIAAGLFNTELALDTDGDNLGDSTVLNNALQEFIALIPSTGNTLDLRIRVSSNSSNEEMAFDFFELLENYTLSFDDLSFNQEFSFYPNPVKNNLTISFGSNKGVLKVDVYNLIGQKINSTKVIENQSEYNFSFEQPKGIYFVHIQDENNRKIIKKIIKD